MRIPTALKFTAIVIALAAAIVLADHGLDRWRLAREDDPREFKQSSRHSGYTPGTAQWVSFVQCWRKEYAQRVAGMSPDRQRVHRDLTVLNKGKFATPEDAARVADEIVRAEQALGEKLPPSYKDFVMAYTPGGLVSDFKQNVITLFAVDQLKRFEQVDPLAIAVARKYPIDAPDMRYLKYGVGQDDIAIRTHYRKNAIMIGMYGSDSFESIVLYPQVRTVDAEMEAALIMHAGEFRAPSFAELMRQLSYLEIKDPKFMPPHAQKALKGTCADELPLKDVWWD